MVVAVDADDGPVLPAELVAPPDANCGMIVPSDSQPDTVTVRDDPESAPGANVQPVAVPVFVKSPAATPVTDSENVIVYATDDALVGDDTDDKNDDTDGRRVSYEIDNVLLTRLGLLAASLNAPAATEIVAVPEAPDVGVKVAVYDVPEPAKLLPNDPPDTVTSLDAKSEADSDNSKVRDAVPPASTVPEPPERAIVIEGDVTSLPLGVSVVEYSEYAASPFALLARTRARYAVPFTMPDDTVTDVASKSASAVAISTSDEFVMLTSYPVTALPPSSTTPSCTPDPEVAVTAGHDTVSCPLPATSVGAAI